jgi:ABC-type transporter Mla subunit MlaD
MAIDLEMSVYGGLSDEGLDAERSGGSGGVWPLGELASRTDPVGRLARDAGAAFDDLGQIASEFSCGAARSALAASTISDRVDDLSAALAQVSAAVESLRSASGDTT